MSGIINLLPDSLANQIAAGEVIQRPASAVKELLENALDAKSKNIQLIIKDSGKTLIQIVDDGIGMSDTDARLCFERHATSKIRQSDDLFNIRSFGFRGEALASIAAVAHVELKTKRQEDELGTHIIVEGSTVKKQEPCQIARGTSFSVRNLFFNVPARRKFLKSDPVELKHILEEFIRVSLPNPDVHFSVHHNDNELYHFPISNLRQRVTNYFGKNVNEKIVPVNEETDFIKISGFIGKPDFVKKSRGDQYLFVNKRFIKSNYLNHAIKMAYENLIPTDQHPFFVILLEVDPALIDVNIHPTKQEVKFENERLIYNYLRVAVKHALGKYSITPSLDFESVNMDAFEQLSNAQAIPSTNRAHSSSTGGHTDRIQYNPDNQPTRTEKDKWTELYKDLNNAAGDIAPGTKAITLSSDWSEDEQNDVTPEDNHKNSFQVHESYIISPIKSGLMVIDQEAAHERVLYERYLNLLNNHKIVSQKSLFPETIQIDPKNAKILDILLDELSYIGFGIEKIGMTTYLINSLPSEGLSEEPRSYIDNFIQTYASNTEIQISIKENIARSMAVNNRIKKGSKLELEEIVELIDQLFACKMPYKSPSGKKCFITYGLNEIQNRFKN